MEGSVDDAEARYEQSGEKHNTQPLIDDRFPNKPHNHSKTLPFHDLFLTLFNPLNDNKKKPTGPTAARRKQGPQGQASLNPHEIRRSIIERFISRWRKEVGDDIYPAFRLIVPEKDRDRAMYGLKEKAIGKLLVKVMKIDRNSEDGFNLLNWKLPGQTAASRMAGDFAGRCFEVLSKRPMRATVGDMTIGEVNDSLDRLAAAQKEDGQLSILQEFYNRMNSEEMLWLIRIILRQMKVGASEKTIFDVWHPDAEGLFNVSSSLRRVCWELHDPSVRLEGEERGVALMQCFQPQLAQFQMHNFQKILDKMRPTETDGAFWIEEKLDGERMQLHMVEDESVEGGKRFGFWSRKAKDYTYLYGNGFMDENGALTRHIKPSFHAGVRNIILDGEMITWDPEQDAIVPFGTLKTAALAEQRNPYTTGQRPLYRVFDILYLNGEPITSYTLRDRRRALETSIKSIHRRMEIHPYQEAFKAEEIDPMLRKVVAEASEGLVLKNPRSMYRLNERNDDWMKVKPEYMNEFGESLDCLVVGGYYGSGSRGGRLSSFLCGLRVDQVQIDQGANPMKCFSFFKVGGGFSAADYASVRHQTDGKWRDWDPKKPPIEFVELGGGPLQYERPDVWIKPDDSVVFSVKAASISFTDSFRVGLTLRFPRFKGLRTDKDWKSALSIREFMDLKNSVEKERKDKDFIVETKRKKIKTRKKALTVAGNDDKFATPYAGAATEIFEGLDFFIMTEAIRTQKKSKAEVEQLVKANGGKIYQTHSAGENTICIADKRTVKVASLQKAGHIDIVHHAWLFDCVRQCEIDGNRPRFILPLEPEHMFFISKDSDQHVEDNVDEYGDSYARDVTTDELRKLFDKMPAKDPDPLRSAQLKQQLSKHWNDINDSIGWLFADLEIYIDRPSFRKSSLDRFSTSSSTEKGDEPEIDEDEITALTNMIKFADGHIINDLNDKAVTHVVIGDERSRAREIREMLKRRKRLPRVVTSSWITESWSAKTRLDEERFAP